MKNPILALFKSLKHFFKKPNTKIFLVLMLIMITTSTILFSLKLMGNTYNYRLGDKVTENIRVNNTIIYEEKNQTEHKRMLAMQAEPLIFEMDNYIVKDRQEIVSSLFDKLQLIKSEKSDLSPNEQLMYLKQTLPRYIIYKDDILLTLLGSQNQSKIQRIILQILDKIYQDGILESPYENSLAIPNNNVVIKSMDVDGMVIETLTKLDGLISFQDLKNDKDGRLSIIVSESGGYMISNNERNAVYAIVKNLIKPNLSFKSDKTKKSIAEAYKRVNPVRSILQEGQIIAKDGDIITEDILRKIDILNNYASKIHYNYIIGLVCLQLVYFIIFIQFILKATNMLLPNRKATIISFSLIMLFMIYTFIVSVTDTFGNSGKIFSLFLPIAAISIMLTVLYNSYFSMLVSFYLVFFSYVISGASFSSLTLAVSSALLGIITIRDIEKRTEFLIAGLWIAVINILLVIAIGLMEENSFNIIGYNIMLAALNGFLNALLVTGLFPIYENVFKLTTRFNLLELSDLNAPIFKRMLVKAPGTYNHSLMVANMAEAACKEIKANHLLARVGGYYHDIGKIDSPELYIENKGVVKGAPDLAPLQYAKKIIDHVRVGVEIARQNKIPDDIIDFIREHHGDSVMTFFYHQALGEAAETGNTSADINKSDFQYPGPKPHSKETAIVMLADAIEAASRSLEEPSYVKLEGLVKKIIHNKLNENALDNSNLTMQEFSLVQKAFLRVLAGIFHTRLEYPEQEDIKALEKRVMSQNK